MSNSHNAESRSKLQAAIDRVSGDKDACELVYVSQPDYPLSPDSEVSTSKSTLKPHLVILDSSFNPPHNAHLAMASSSLPPPLPTSESSSSTSRPSSSPYTARLLLFSVKNIEKIPKEGDASMVQRLEMTILLARRLAQFHNLPGGIGVGILNEPTFVGKSRILHSFLSRRLGSSPEKVARFSFLIGTDTLTRFFEPKFYEGIGGMDKASRDYFGIGEGHGEGSLLICGRRGEGEENRRIEDEVLGRDEVRPWVERGCVRMLEPAKGLEDVSSTEIRKAVQETDKEMLDKLLPREIEDYIKEEGLYIA